MWNKGQFNKNVLYTFSLIKMHEVMRIHISSVFKDMLRRSENISSLGLCVGMPTDNVHFTLKDNCIYVFVADDEALQLDGQSQH